MSVAVQALSGSASSGSWPPTLSAISHITNHLDVGLARADVRAHHEARLESGDARAGHQDPWPFSRP
jgi:hypothetical protein